MSTLLVVDDDPLTLDCFRLLFTGGKVNVLTAASAEEGLQQFTKRRPDVVVLDVHLPDLSGLDAFLCFQEKDGRVPVIFITGYGTASTAIEAMRRGAFEYVVKPLDPEALRNLIARAFEISRLMRVPALLPEAEVENQEADLLVGHCAAMREVYKAIGRVAPQDVTVLLQGESGTGKELVARAIYYYSKRSTGPFQPINCAAIPETLLESELFGHEKGAFTGAERRRIGKFEQCSGGTLFLDEIGDMTPLTQTKILRVLQDQRFERVGSNETIQTDVRIIAATNRDLKALTESGRFRKDLFYRLNVFTLVLPPLRERGEDLPLLAQHFLRILRDELGKEVNRIAPETLKILQGYSWPGNIRELQSVLKQTLLQATGPVLLPEFLPPVLRGDQQQTLPVGEADRPQGLTDLTRFIENRLQAGSTNLHAEFLTLTERHLLLHVMKHTGNNLTQASRILGISRATLRSKLGVLGMTVERSSSLEEDEGP
jgi:two-component system nitrogen regulation response regulator GlnG